MKSHSTDLSSLKCFYETPLPSSRTGVFYNTFAYPTKISPESIAVYIAVHTKPGDTILDVFSGSGSTGIAALMCEHPTDSMITLAKKIDVHPTWGLRNAILYEIGKYGAFASNVMANPPSKDEFTAAVSQLLLSAENEIGGYYRTADPIGEHGTIRHIIHADVMLCPHCNNEFTFYAGMVQYEPLAIDRNGICPHCGYKDVSSNFHHVTETVFDSLLCKQITRRKRVPVRIYGQSDREKWVRDATETDIQELDVIDTQAYPPYCHTQEIKWGELYRAGYHSGITHLHHFYTKRNFLVMSYLWEKSSVFPQRIRNAIQLLLLSYNATHATLMTRVVVKKNSKDFVLTGAQSGVLYISSLPVEKNIIEGIKRKRRRFEETFDFLNKCGGRIEVFNESSRHLKQTDASVDYVFTDPPFGDFIPYAEVNQINELWLGEPTTRDDEIIISQSQNKESAQYQEMMADVFLEMKRVLKNDGYATVVFHSSKAAVWNALCAAYSASGFNVADTASLHKNQASFKQVVSDGSVQGDPMILLSKGVMAISDRDSRTVLDEAIAGEYGVFRVDERRIYADYIGKCLKLGIRVDYDAKAAYSYIAQKAGAMT
jgi:16S rRNA G966 N2-methylase RsmD